jgi:hypothetical protein
VETEEVDKLQVIALAEVEEQEGRVVLARTEGLQVLHRLLAEVAEVAQTVVALVLERQTAMEEQEEITILMLEAAQVPFVQN